MDNLNTCDLLTSCNHSQRNSVESIEQDTDTYPKVVDSLSKENLTSEDILAMLNDRIQSLLKCNINVDKLKDLEFIQQHTRYSSDVALQRRIVERIVRSGIAHVYLRVWQTILAASNDYLSPENIDSFRMLQTALSIIWNCTDKSVTLCESLVRVAVVNLFLSELASPSLFDADLDVDDSRRYLVKAYLGVLHNIVRLCPDSRKIYRSANAVPVLQAYLDLPQGLVRTKAYLILSYIVSEEENDIINATDENLAYIVEILKAALEGENHFASEYAFWAAEIAAASTIWLLMILINQAYVIWDCYLFMLSY